MKVLVSAYACEPDQGSEPGAGYALVRAAAETAECWVLTRANNVDAVQQALDREPTTYPVNLIPIDASPALLSVKKRLRSVRAYYVLWQRLAGRVALNLDFEIDFDLVHHATMSAFWLPVGVMVVPKPLVVGPVSGGTLTPPSLLGYLGLNGFAFDLGRWAASRLAGIAVGGKWQRAVFVLLAQNEQMRRYAEKRLAGSNATVLVHCNASNPSTPGCTDVMERVPEILFVGRLLSWKGVFLALEGFARANVPQARLVFIGEGEANKALARKIRKLGLEERVDLAGAVPRAEVLRRMCSASALLFPSFHDSAGFVVSEALSLGLPVVCLDHGGPGFLTRLWPDVPHEAVSVGPASAVLDDIARATEKFVREPAALHREPMGPSTNLSDVISRAYQTALAGGGS